MADSDLDRLGDTAFEQLVATICLHALGAGVQFFGRGPDGGREATFEGAINWSATLIGDEDTWRGYTVIQAKFCEEPGKPAENAAWLWGELKKEIDRWKIRAHSQRVPDYLLFATNVRLSAVANKGGIDTIERNIRQHIKGRPANGTSGEIKPLRGVKGWKVWHADQIGILLNGYPAIRYAFPAFLTPGDVLATIAQYTQGVESVAAAMQTHVLQALSADRWIRLSESGSATGEKTSIEEIAIDLPATLALASNDQDDDSQHQLQTVTAARYAIASGDQVLRPSIADPTQPRHLVVLGGPGQGKTTLGNLIAQAYRLAILQDSDLTPEAAALVERTRARLQAIGLDAPGNRRWPMRVDLSEYAEAISGGTNLSILKWLAHKISSRIAGDVTANQLLSWLRAWPWVLILDGLDEVTSPTVREDLLTCVDDLRTEAGQVNADLFIVATSRPLGYAREFDDQFAEMRLERLAVGDALKYAETLAAARHRDDPDLREQVLRRMQEAADDESRQRLMETPLQVTIMSFILERFPRLPPDRYSLFSQYYETMYAREASKRTPLAKLLMDYRAHVEYIHERAGLALHLKAEHDGEFGGQPTMSEDSLLAITRERLISAGYDSPEVDRSASELVRAATHRLVLLTPQGSEIGFEVRTLQELMAARYLTSAADELALRRLAETAHSPHWRNTWLLAAGRILAEREHLSDQLIGLLDVIDSDPRRFTGVFPTAPELAADMILDRLASDRPALRRAILHKLLDVLAGPPPSNPFVYAQALLVAAQDRVQAEAIFARLRAAGRGNARDRAGARLLLETMLDDLFERNEVSAKIRLLLRGIDASPEDDTALAVWTIGDRRHILEHLLHIPDAESVSAITLREYIEPIFARAELSLDDLENRYLVPHLSPITVYAHGDHAYASHYAGIVFSGTVTFADADTASAMEIALLAIEPAHWPIASLLQVGFRSRFTRLPVLLDEW